MKDKIFIDSNIFLYAFSSLEKDKQVIAADILKGGAVVSTQIINEVSNNLLRKFQFPNSSIRDFVTSCYKRYHVASMQMVVFLRAAELRDGYALSYWDSLVVATAIENRCNVLLTEDMQHGLVVDKAITIINPFEGIATK